jgi:hypothetical protein
MCSKQQQLANIALTVVNMLSLGPALALATGRKTLFSGDFMLRHRLAGSLIVTTLLAGCATAPQPTPPPQTSHPVTLQQLTALRDAHRSTPDFRVGLVKAVLPENSTVALGDVGVNDFSVGDVISIVDSEQRTVAMGNVDSIDTAHKIVIVKYTTLPGGRAPAPGDLGIRAIK